MKSPPNSELSLFLTSLLKDGASVLKIRSLPLSLFLLNKIRILSTSEKMVPGSGWCIKVREKSSESLLVKWQASDKPWTVPQASVTLEVPAAQRHLGGPKQLWQQAPWSPAGCDFSTVSLGNPNVCKEKWIRILWWRQAIPILGCLHLEHHSKPLGGHLGYLLVSGQDPCTDRLKTSTPSSSPARVEKSPSPSSAHGKPCQHLAIPLPHTHVLWSLPSSSSSMFLIIYSL